MNFSGIVQKGKGEGTKTGFPTANISLTDGTVSGIYVGKVVADGKDYLAAVYADQRRGLLEAHLINFSGDLYGKELAITLLEKIRDDMTFDTTEKLLAQIRKDVAAVREIGHTF